MARPFRITIYRAAPPPASAGDVNKDIQWFCTSLGLVGNRDRNLSTFRIFISLLKARQHGRLLSSDNLAAETDLSRATVIHHLNKLAGSGIVQEEQERYRLTVDNMQHLVDHLKQEMEDSMRELEEMSRRIDEQLGLR
jgi:predicted transcriptional regulator